MNARVTSTLLFILISIVLFSCAHTPVTTNALINKQAQTQQDSSFHFFFKDDREEIMKTEKCFVLQYKYPTWIFSCGDLAFDMPLGVVFEKLFVRRFGNNPNGYQTEVTLKAFHYTNKPHELAGAPFIGLLTIGADIEWHGILRVEIAVLDKNQKFIFQKTYDTDIREMKKPFTQSEQDNGFDMLMKAFTKISNEVDIDINRIRL